MSELVKLLRQGASISRSRNINLDFAKVADEAAGRITELEAQLADAKSQWIPAAPAIQAEGKQA